MEIIKKYFEHLSPVQEEQFVKMSALYRHLNSMVNLISRKDIDHLYERHVLHSLSIAKFIDFKRGTHILDAGTGGGFPGIPLAILFPEVHFTLVDSIRKKINCVNQVVNELGLKNVIPVHIRMEEIKNTFDYVVSRALTSLPGFYKWARPLVSKRGINFLPNGVIYLKGGYFIPDLVEINMQFYLYSLSDFFEEEYFQTKKLVFISV